MPSPQNQMSAKAQSLLGLPDGFKAYSNYPFAGINQQSTPIAMDDKEFVWLENFARIGDGNLRTVWDVGSPIWQSIDYDVVYHAFYNLGESLYCFVCFSNGRAIQIAMADLSVTQIGPVGAFYTSVSGNLPYIKQWGTQYLLICNNNNPNNYWAWDGTLLYTAGTAAAGGVNILSGGFNYSSTPTITPYGGEGTGLALTAVEQGGSIVAINITNPGSGYQVGDNVQLAFSGGGSDTSAILTAKLNAGGVGGVNITNPGTSYTSATVAFSGGGGTGAAGTVIIGSGVTAVAVTAGGTGYTGATGSFIGGGGSGATCTITLVGTAVTAVVITSAGSGYTTAPTFVFNGVGGSGATFGAVTIANGVIVGVQITDPGTGYTSAPTVAFSGTGSAATGVSLLAPSGVASVMVTNGGTGFTTVPLITFVGGGGSGATGTVNLTPTSIAAVNLTGGGSGYTSAPSISFNNSVTATTGGAGSGAAATAVVSSNTIIGVTLSSGGSGYTAPPTIVVSGGGGTGAVLAAVITGGVVTKVVVQTGGSGYASTPTLTFTSSAGSTGSGATAIANMNGDTVASVTLTNGGSGYTGPVQVMFTGGGGSGAGGFVVFTPTSIASVNVANSGEFYTNAPTVEVTPGANNSAYATVSLMPYGVSGSAMETYLSRIWIVDPAPQAYQTLPSGGQFLVSAPSSFIDFSTADGGVSALNTDAFLQRRYVNVRQSSGYLYMFGDGSVSNISSVSTTAAQGAATVSTTYNYSNVDPQAGLGLKFRDAIADFGRSIIAANQTGIYGLYGGTLSKISGKLDQLFQNAIFPPTVGAVVPSAAIAFIFNVKHYLLLMTVKDPDTSAYRNVMVTWNEKDWTITSQTVPLIQISTQKIGSEYYAYGTDGHTIYPLFNAPSAKLTKKFDTKQYGSDRMFVQKQWQSVHMQVRDESQNNAGISGAWTAVVSGIAIQNAQFPSLMSVTSDVVFNVQPTNLETPYPYFGLWGTSIGGIYFVSSSLRFQTMSPDFTIGNMAFGYIDKLAYFGQ